MDHRDIDALMAGIAPVLREIIADTVQPLHDRIKTLEGQLASDISDAVAKAVAALPPAEPGKSVTVDDVAPLIDAAVAKAVADLPPAKAGEPGEPGKSVTVDDVAPLIDAAVAKAVADLPPAKAGEPGEPGKSVTVDDVAPLIDAAVAKAVADLPPAKAGEPGEPGKSVTVDDVAPLIDAAVAKAVEALPDPVGLAGALIDREGQLVVTLSDGSARTLGPVVGKDGVDIDMDAVLEAIKGEVANLPKAKDGIDGFGFDDMQLMIEDDTIKLVFTQGERVKEFVVPVPVDCGVWKPRSYKAGNGVTWGGSFFIAQRQTLESEKPGEQNDGWRLAVKRGRDGKNIEPVKLPKAGEPVRLPGAKVEQGAPDGRSV